MISGIARRCTAGSMFAQTGATPGRLRCGPNDGKLRGMGFQPMQTRGRMPMLSVTESAYWFNADASLRSTGSYGDMMAEDGACERNSLPKCVQSVLRGFGWIDGGDARGYVAANGVGTGGEVANSTAFEHRQRTDDVPPRASQKDGQAHARPTSGSHPAHAGLPLQAAVD